MNGEKDQRLPSEPEETGVDARQVEISPPELGQLVRGSATGAISAYPLTDAIRDIAEGGVRGLAGMILLQAFTQKLEADLSEVRSEKKEILADANKWKDNYHNEKEKCAVLGERLRNLRKMKILENVFLTLGGIVIGISTRYLSWENPWSIAGLIFGGCLLLIGWFSSFRYQEEVPL